MPIDSRLLLETDRFQVVELTCPRPGAEPLRRQVVRHPGAVTIVPMVDPDHVCLIHNYRVSVDQTLLELPAGTREPNEPPQLTAARELTEETGFRAGKIELLSTFYLSPGILDECMYLYVATDLTAGAPQREAGEQIENCVLHWDDAMQRVADGKIHDAKTLVGLLMYGQLRHKA